MKITPKSACGLAAGLSTLGAVAQQQAPKALNVVYILADDLGYGDLSAYNPEGLIRTPSLDSLAARSVRFTNAHSSAAVSTPTRYGLLTGSYPWRGPLKQGVLWTWGAPLLGDCLTLPEMMRRRGYTTGLVGKWHLGITFATTDGAPVDKAANGANVDYTRPIVDGPTHHGFDDYYGDDVPNFPPYVFIENDRFTELPTQQTPAKGFPGVPGAMAASWRPEKLLPIQSSKSAEYIRAHKNAPFFLLVSLTAPHTPIAPNPEFEGRSQAGRYGDFVEEMDFRIGEILAAIRDAGLEERTVVVFSSDNGSSFQDGGNSNGERYAGRFGSILDHGHNPSGRFRGMKSDAWEGGHRIPMLVRWPSLTDQGQTSNALVCDLDIFATLAEYLGCDLSPDAAPDSRSLLPLLRGQAPVRKDLVVQSGNGVLCYIDQRWKLIASSGSGGSLNPYEQRGELPYYDRERSLWRNIQLYDLRSDPEERYNISITHPHAVGPLVDSLARRAAPAPGENPWPQIAWALEQTN